LLAAVQAASAAAYERESAGELMVWPLATLTPALVLHGPTRRALPAAVSTHLSSWVARNPVLVAGLPQRVASLAPAVQEGLRFGVRHGLLELREGRVRGTVRGTARLEGELAGRSGRCRRVADQRCPGRAGAAERPGWLIPGASSCWSESSERMRTESNGAAALDRDLVLHWHVVGEEEEKRPGNERKRSLGGEAHGYCARTDEHRIFDCTSKN
jgi:hypothetical protein